MFRRNVTVLRADALCVSALQRSDELSPGQIRQVVAVAVDAYGVAGSAGRVAQEFGDHPETAVARMSWARAVVAVLDDQLVPSTGGCPRPTAQPGRSHQGLGDFKKAAEASSADTEFRYLAHGETYTLTPRG